MLNIYTVAFFGHKYIDNPFPVKQRLEEYIKSLIFRYEYVDFLVGRNGDFDQIAAASVFHVRKEHRCDNSSLILVLPYIVSDYINNKNSFLNYYSEVEICEKASAAHPKSAIEIRNREMIKRADLILCYLNKNEGNTLKLIQYALKLGKDIVNLAN